MELSVPELARINKVWLWWNKKFYPGQSLFNGPRRWDEYTQWLEQNYGITAGQEFDRWTITNPKKYTLFLLEWA
jgi:hypothetical protein